MANPKWKKPPTYKSNAKLQNAKRRTRAMKKATNPLLLLMRVFL